MRNNLLRLLAENREARARTPIRAAKDGDTTTVTLYDYIVSDDFWGGVSAKTVAAVLAGIDTPRIVLRINSPGGDVFAGKAIAALIKEHPAHVVARIDGVAASIASIIAIAADEVVMDAGAMMMIHRSWALIAGNSNDMLEFAALLEKVDTTLASEYVRVTGKDEKEIIAAMDAETWFTAQEAVDFGLAHSVAEENKDEEPKARWSLDAYKNAPVAAKAPVQETAALLKAPNARDDAERRLRVLEMV